MNFLMVIMASGIARGRVRTTMTESRKMAIIWIIFFSIIWAVRNPKSLNLIG